MLNQVSKMPMTSVLAGVTTEAPTDPNSTSWSIKINKGTATTGTVTLTAKSRGATTAETVYDSNGVAIVFNAASSTAQTYYFPNTPVDLVVMTPSTLDGTYTYALTQW